MKLFLSLTLIVVACITTPVATQRWQRQWQRQRQQQQQQQQQQSQYCVTPQNVYGSCVPLSLCPQIANNFRTRNRGQTRKYITFSQRACGTRSIDGDPVVCCSEPVPLPQTNTSPPRQSEEYKAPSSTTIKPKNPFLPVTTSPVTVSPLTQAPSIVLPETRTPKNPFLPDIIPRVTQAPTIVTQPPSTPNTSPSRDYNLEDYCRGPDLREGICKPMKECHALVTELVKKQTDVTFSNFLKASNRICGNVNTNVCCPNSTPSITTESPNSTNGNLQDNKTSYCRGPDLREGNCKPLEECEPLLAKQNDTSFTAFLQASKRICNNMETNVCCPHSSSTTIKFTTKSPLIRNSNEIPTHLPTADEGCGYSANYNKKIVGGVVSKVGAWPWIALIGYDLPSPFKCGGTLVSARHVITAAHCQNSKFQITFVRLGEHDLTTDTEAHHVDINVVRIEKHPDYYKPSGRNDIAVLYLERNVEFSDTISPICMPTSPQLRQKTYVRYNPFVIGWGKTMEGGTPSNVLQELQIPIYENQICRDRYKQKKLLIAENQFDEAVICAGVLSGGKDTCQGDSGGPLMIPEPFQNAVRFYLIGVVSYGVGCARPEIPGVYTSTQYFIDWIIEKIADISYLSSV
ncbi:venom serine protease Bi-VSP-like [Cochliomyia hominivorax]